MPNRAAPQVLADHSLFQSIASFAPGIPFFALRVKRQLKCAQPGATVLEYIGSRSCIPPEDIALWKNAVLAGDKRTLEALHVLASLGSDVGRQVRVALRGIFDFVVEQVMETRDTSLPDWIHASGLFPFAGVSQRVLFQLGERGDVQMLRWLHEHGHFIDRAVAIGAAKRGHLDMLQCIQSVGREKATIDEGAIQHAAAKGHLHVLEFLLQQTEWDLRRDVTHAFSRAIEFGQLHVVEYLRENGFRCKNDDLDSAAANGHLDVVKYLQMNEIGNNGTRALSNALKNRHLEVAKFLIATGWTCDVAYTGYLVKNDELEIPQLLCERGGEYYVDKALELAVEHHSIKLAKFLYALNPAACARQGNYWASIAADRGFFEFIEFFEFFHACGDPKAFDRRAMREAALKGNLNIYKIVHENREVTACLSCALLNAIERGHNHVADNF